MSLLLSGPVDSEEEYETRRFKNQSGRRFVPMVRNSEYGQRHLRLCFRKPLHIRGNCDVYLMTGQGQTGLHWRLLVRMNELTIALPVLSIEINTPDLQELIAVIRRYREVPIGAKFKGYVQGISIMDIYELADQVQGEMQKYQLVSRNCQDFCNDVLERLNLPTETTTAGGIKSTVFTTAGVALAATVAKSICSIM